MSRSPGYLITSEGRSVSSRRTTIGQVCPWTVWADIGNRWLLFLIVFKIVNRFCCHCLFQALPYVALLIVMLFFIYAVIGMQVRIEGRLLLLSFTFSHIHFHWSLTRVHSFIHSAISIAPLQVLYHSEALPTTARILYRSFMRTGNCR